MGDAPVRAAARRGRPLLDGLGPAVGVGDGEVAAQAQRRPLGDDVEGDRGVRGVGEGGVEDAAGTGGVLQGDLGGVLHLDRAGQRPGARVPLDARDVAHQPLHEVDGVDGLVHQQPAAAAGPGGAPRPVLVVAGVPVPDDGGRGPADRPQLAGGQPLLQRPDGGVVAVLEADGDLRPAGLRGGGQPLAVGEGGGHRLLQHDVHALREGGQRHLDVGVVRGGDVDDVGPDLRQQRRLVGEAGDAVLLGGRLPPARVGLDDPDQLDVGQGGEGVEVDDGDVAAPDHGCCGHGSPGAAGGGGEGGLRSARGTRPRRGSGR